MNKARRKNIAKARELIEGARTAIEEAATLIETAAEEERDYYDNMPESLQQGEKGEQADTAATALEEVKDALEGTDWEYVVSKLEEAEA